MTSFLPVLGVDQNRPIVSSLQLAEHFDIKHRHILRDIRSISLKVPTAFTESNFGPSEYTDPTGRNVPCYNLTRDGFTLLAMGYNSARAIEWKLKYIEAFNALEKIAIEAVRTAALTEAAQAALEIFPADRARLKKMIAYRKRGFSQREVAAVMKLHTRRVGQLMSTARKLGLEV